jgi:AraC-like DNA-binding protein
MPARHDHVIIRPRGPLAPFLERFVGYRHEGLAPGRHLGLPAPSLTLVISLGEPTRVSSTLHPAPAEEFQALIGGMSTRPVVISYGRSLHGVQLDLTPLGARTLLGLPAAELTDTVVSLDQVLGARSEELVYRMWQAGSFGERFSLIERALTSRIANPPERGDTVHHAWRAILSSGGEARIAEVARSVGWSRRQLDSRFEREYGLAPKLLAQIVRFENSRRLLSADPQMRLASLAAACGFYDQAHMAREWNRFAGCPPSRWLASEDLPFVQDEPPAGMPS